MEHQRTTITYQALAGLAARPLDGSDRMPRIIGAQFGQRARCRWGCQGRILIRKLCLHLDRAKVPVGIVMLMEEKRGNRRRGGNEECRRVAPKTRRSRQGKILEVSGGEEIAMWELWLGKQPRGQIIGARGGRRANVNIHHLGRNYEMSSRGNNAYAGYQIASNLRQRVCFARDRSTSTEMWKVRF